MNGFSRAANLDALPIGGRLAFEHEGETVVLFRLAEDEVYAVDACCPHRGGPLAEGELEGCVATCPLHGWRFDVRSGRMEGNDLIGVSTWETRIRDGAVWLGPKTARC